MNHQLISSEGNGGNCNPSAESGGYIRSLSVLLSLSILTSSIAILNWTNVNTTHLAVHTARRKDRCNNHLHLKRGTWHHLRWASRIISRPKENACNHGVRVCATAFRSASAPSHLFGLSAVVVGKPAIAKSVRRRIIHACAVVPCACVYIAWLYFILKTTGVNLRIGAPVKQTVDVRLWSKLTLGCT
jgi:hypothetical protein